MYLIAKVPSQLEFASRALRCCLVISVILLNMNPICFPVTTMRSSSLRNGARPENSMDQVGQSFFLSWARAWARLFIEHRVHLPLVQQELSIDTDISRVRC